jgi:hypothetical protein
MEVSILSASFTFTNVKLKTMADPLIAEVCGYPFPVSFVQMLASTLMKNAAGTILGFNVMVSTANTCDCVPVIDCDNNHIPPENLLVMGFGVDDCGHLAIKLVNCENTDFSREQ